MSIEVGIVMDPIGSIIVKKDTTLAMMLAAQRRGWALRYMELGDLFVRDGTAHARMRPIEVRDDPRDWYTLGEIGHPAACVPRRHPDAQGPSVRHGVRVLDVHPGAGGGGRRARREPAAEPARRQREDVHGLVPAVLPTHPRHPRACADERVPPRARRHHREAARRHGRGVDLPGAHGRPERERGVRDPDPAADPLRDVPALHPGDRRRRQAAASDRGRARSTTPLRGSRRAATRAATSRRALVGSAWRSRRGCARSRGRWGRCCARRASSSSGST